MPSCPTLPSSRLALGAALLVALLGVPRSASADPTAPAPASGHPAAAAAPATAATGSSTATEEYVDQTDASGQRVVFKDDPLGADGNAATGASIVVRPRAARVGLLRPRVHFIPEMLKSVENL